MKKIVSATVLLLITLLISFALVEGMVRVWNPSLFNSNFRSYHPQLGWTNQVNKTFHRAVNKDRLVRYETNSLGFRDVDHSKEHGRNIPGKGLVRIKRVVVLGDSFSESAQVNLNQSYWRLLGEKLNSNSKHFWEVHNFGVGGYGTTQQLMTLEMFALQYRPDIVITQIFPQNDIYNNALSGANIASNQDAYRPYLNPDDEFKTITYLSPITTRLRQHSQLFRMLSPLISKTFGPLSGEENFISIADRMAHIRDRAGAAGFTNDMGAAPFDYFLVNTFAPHEEQFEWIQEGWSATETALTKIISVSQAHNAKPMMIVVPHPSMMPPMSTQLKNRLPYSFDPQYAEKRISRHTQQYGVQTINSLNEFNDKPDIVKPYIDGHLNVATHRLLADILAEKIMTNFPEIIGED